MKEKQLEELLDAKTSALQRADQLNALCRNQSLSNEANMKKLTHMLTLSQEENQSTSFLSMFTDRISYQA